MAHELEIVNGEAQMAYVGEVPWHGLGTQVDSEITPAEMLVAAGLDWTVSQHPLFAEVPKLADDGVQLVDEHGTPLFTRIGTPNKALIRDTDKKLLTISGEDWRPTQNHEAFEFFREFCEVGGAKMNTAGSLHGGKHVWALAELGKGFTLPGGDRTEGYLLFSLPHLLGKAISVRTTSVRVVCQNTLSFAMRGKTGSEFRQSHLTDFNFDKAKMVVEMANQNLSDQAEFCNKLIKVDMGPTEAIQFFHNLISDEALAEADAQGVIDNLADIQRSRLGQIVHSYYKAPGANQTNAFGVLNGLTHWCDHASGKSQDKRMWDTWFGCNLVLKNNAIAKLSELI